MIDPIVIKQSTKGIQKEIDRRTWCINALVRRVTGHEPYFQKPTRNQLPVMMQALDLYREVKRLRVIKSQMASL